MVNNCYEFCQITSADEVMKQAICMALNLNYSPTADNTVHTLNSSSAAALATEIKNRTGVSTDIIVIPIAGDGNCLFRALSQAVTGSQDQHALIRSYVVNHMMDDSMRDHMQCLFQRNRNTGSVPLADYHNYLVEMQKPGTWGTDQEIVAAAHLLNCSILCLSRYGTSNRYCLQHIPPHFAEMSSCNMQCRHESMYLINSSGTHYETAVVKRQETPISNEQ